MRKILAAILFGFSTPVTLASSDIDSGIYSTEQAVDGRSVYNAECAICHGKELEGGEAGPDLAGIAFRDRWRNLSLSEFFNLTKKTMPVTRPAGLTDKEYTDVVAFILNRNAYATGQQVLDADKATMGQIRFADPTERMPASLESVDAGDGLMVEWLHHRGNPGSMNYSELDLINRNNAGTLKIAWQWKSDNFGPAPWPNLQTTPIMANGILFATAGIRRTVVAIDATTGETLWMYRIDEGERGENAPRKGPGRGVAYQRTDGRETVYVISPGYRLIALNAKNGQPLASFGENGIVDLKSNMEQDLDPVQARIGSSSPPIIVNGVIIVGSAFPAGGAPPKKEMPAGNVTGYDAVTGERLWIFNTVPQPGEYGNETWGETSWKYTGNTGVWAPMSADPELGYVYLPIEAPTGDFYGGHRPGANLFAQSLVCLDAKTGKRIWHFQTVHHPIWDYDLPAAPVLIDIKVDGAEIPAVAQITKQGFTFVFDRRTGKPVWPIEERPVPGSTVPGDTTSPTQPFPSLPETFEPQGVTPDNLNNLTPEIHQEALRIASNYTMGPIYTPPTLITNMNKGTLVAPGPVGGANWQGAVADPETGLMYVSSATAAVAYGMLSDPDRSNMRYVLGRAPLKGPFDLPLLRPPWGRITAINLNTGKIQWVIANGDTPQDIKTHEKLREISLPRTGHDDRAGLLVTKSLLFAGEGSGLYATSGRAGTKFRAHDKLTGEIIAEIDLGLSQTGVPMTYALNGQQFIVVAAGAPNHSGELIALTVDKN